MAHALGYDAPMRPPVAAIAAVAVAVVVAVATAVARRPVTPPETVGRWLPADRQPTRR